MQSTAYRNFEHCVLQIKKMNVGSANLWKEITAPNDPAYFIDGLYQVADDLLNRAQVDDLWIMDYNALEVCFLF